MKEKLSKIREALKYMESSYKGSHCPVDLKGSITLLDSILADLDSPGLVHRINEAIFNAECKVLSENDFKNSIDEIQAVGKAQAQAAINTIKGE